MNDAWGRTPAQCCGL